MRPKHRAPLPDLALLLRVVNELLDRHGLPPCQRLASDGIDADTYNPVVAGIAEGRRYAIKLKARFTQSLSAELAATNALAKATGLPIPAHLCCSADGDPFPLVIMEWANGISATKLLPELPVEQVREFFRAWGGCMSRYHHAAIPGLEHESWSDMQSWWRSVAAGPLKQPAMSEVRRQAISRWLAPRLDAMSSPAAPGPTKADDEPHDVLVDGAPPRITALIDWEKLRLGDTACSVAVVYLRLCLLGMDYAWPDFLAGYGAAGAVPPQCAQAEGVLMARALRAAESGRPAAVRIVDRLLEGAGLPFREW